jgi:hypothetical protein
MIACAGGMWKRYEGQSLQAHGAHSVYRYRQERLAGRGLFLIESELSCKHYADGLLSR